MHDAKNTVNLILDFCKVLEYFRHLGPDWSGDPTGALHMYGIASILISAAVNIRIAFRYSRLARG